MKKDKKHIEIRNKVEAILNSGFSIEKVAQKLKLPLGNRFIKKSAKWDRYCIVAKKNQKKAIEKDPNLYSKQLKLLNKNILGLVKNWVGSMVKYNVN